MLGEISMGLQSLKAALDVVKGLNAASTQASINEIKLGLQAHIFEAREALAAAQETQSTSLQRIRDLEQEIVGLKDWEAEKQRYELKAIDRGAFAYMPKTGMESGEPPHWLCANCFNRRQKSLLQFQGQERRNGGLGSDSNYRCDVCKSSVVVNYKRNPSTPWSANASS
jgi:hypothetical protein